MNNTYRAYHPPSGPLETRLSAALLAHAKAHPDAPVPTLALICARENPPPNYTHPTGLRVISHPQVMLGDILLQ